jgi:hypothetical protein
MIGIKVQSSFSWSSALAPRDLQKGASKLRRQVGPYFRGCEGFPPPKESKKALALLVGNGARLFEVFATLKIFVSLAT